MIKPDTAPLWICLRKNNCLRSRALLITRYAYLSHITAERTARYSGNIDRGDLIGAGNVGLIAAIDAFDPFRNIKFETYAITKIRGAILEYIRDHDWVPRSVRDRYRDYQQANYALLVQLRRAPSAGEVARELGITPAELDERLANSQRGALVSLQAPVVQDDGHNTLLQDVLKSCDPSPYDDVTDRDISRVLRAAVAKLPEREQQVINLYHHEDLTFKAISEIMGVSASRVYQIHAEATARMRVYLDSERSLFDREAAGV